VTDAKQVIGIFSGAFLLIAVLFYANSGSISIGSTAPHPRNVILDTINRFEQTMLTIGNGTPTTEPVPGLTFVSSFFETGKGIVTSSTQFGLGLLVKSSNDSVLFRDLSGDAIFIADKKLICNFVTNPFNSSFLKQFLTIATANASDPEVSYTGATGEIDFIVNSSCIVMNTGAAGTGQLCDANQVRYIIYSHPIFSVLDTGTFSMIIGDGEDSEWEFDIPVGYGPHAIDVDDTIAVDSHDVFSISYDSNNFIPGSIFDINILTGDMAKGQNSDLINIVIDPQNSTGGEIHALSLTLSEPDGIDIKAIGTGNGVSVIHQHLGEEESNITVFKSELGVVTDISQDVLNSSIDTEVFIFDSDYIYVGGEGWFGEIDVDLGVFANQPILSLFSFSTGPASWSLFTPNDDTDGFTNNGEITWDPTDLIGWGNETFNGTSRFWVRIQRLRNNLNTPPQIEKMSIVLNTSVVNYFWDKLGNVDINSLTLNNLTTGLNQGTTLCIDDNGQLCLCGFCA